MVEKVEFSFELANHGIAVTVLKYSIYSCLQNVNRSSQQNATNSKLFS